MSRLKVSDAFCYICRGVLIEPVTSPCLHVFCYTCFEESMQETSYSCPLCRKRISNWVRTAKKTDTLINVGLWTKIKEQFRDQVRLKLRGEDDGLDERLKQECPTTRSISGPGEVAKEFSKLISDFQAEQERAQAAEELASKALINKLTLEEKNELEARRREQNLKTQMDEEIARKLQEEINKEVPASSDNQCTSDSQTDKPKQSKGPLDIYLKGGGSASKRKNGLRLPANAENQIGARSTSSDSTDSIQSEMHYFKPIKVVPRTPPKRYPDGKVIEIAVTKVKPLKLSQGRGIATSSDSQHRQTTIQECKKIHSPYSAFIGRAPPFRGMVEESPRKRLRTSADEPDSGVLKEITLGENSDSNSLDVDVKTSQTEMMKKKQQQQQSQPQRGSPKCTRKQAQQQGNFLLPPKLFHFNAIESSAAEESENNADVPQEFDTQDYLDPEPSLRAELIQEQRRIEELILQEKADRELALKLSQEWEVRYELRRKPKERQVTSKRRPRGHENKKLQQSLIGTLVTTRSARNK